MKPLADGQRPALAEDRADTTSGRCVTSRHPTRLCCLPDLAAERQDPMSTREISASRPRPSSSSPRHPGPLSQSNETLDAPAASLTAGSGATLPRPQCVRERPLGPPSLSLVSEPRETVEQHQALAVDGSSSRTSKRSASRSKYETRRRTVRTTHVPTLVVTVFAQRPRRMIRRCDLWASRHAATERSRQPRRPPISAHRRRRPSTALRRTAPTSSSDTDTPPPRGELPVDRGAAQRTTGADGSTRRTVIEAQPNSETSTRRSSSGR